MTFDGEVATVTLINNPYSSYTSGATGSSATLYVYKNGSLYDSDTQAYTGGSAGTTVTFSFSGTTFSAGDYITFKFSANGFWRYCTWGIEFQQT